ncbi:hypothetical protein C8R47DRAFT_1194121 [Mycena vitilis]|nr:hypothetical protein C8R47DRAFT_1194121 [Mycena vitilis]
MTENHSNTELSRNRREKSVGSGKQRPRKQRLTKKFDERMRTPSTKQDKRPSGGRPRPPGTSLNVIMIVQRSMNLPHHIPSFQSPSFSKVAYLRTPTSGGARKHEIFSKWFSYSTQSRRQHYARAEQTSVRFESPPWTGSNNLPTTAESILGPTKRSRSPPRRYQFPQDRAPAVPYAQPQSTPDAPSSPYIRNNPYASVSNPTVNRPSRQNYHPAPQPRASTQNFYPPPQSYPQPSSPYGQPPPASGFHPQNQPQQGGQYQPGCVAAQSS